MKYRNLAEMFFGKRENLPSHAAYMFKKEGEWESIDFQEAVTRAERIAAGLASLGVRKGDRVALISNNRLEWALTDYAVLSLGAALVPIYPTLTARQVAYIINDSEAKVLIAEDVLQMEKASSVLNQLKTVAHYFVIDDGGTEVTTPWRNYDSLGSLGEQFLQQQPDYVADSIRQIIPEDMATIIYTSGTTGNPKGAVLTHKNFISNIESVAQIFESYPEDITLSFLPLSHVLERMAGHFFSCYHGGTVAYAESIDALGENMREVKPTLMVSVPRLYEKMYARVLEAVEAGSPLKRKIFYWSVNVGLRYLHHKMKKEPIPAILKWKRNVADKLVFGKIRERTGGRLRYFVSGGAPLAAEIGEFFAAAGIIILEGYGLTETSPAITFNRPEAFRFGTVGHPLPGVEVKIAEDGEILTRGDHVMVGYLNKEAETREVIDEDGWFHTGDIGFIDPDGYLVITDRKKNIIVTSGGKNVAPQPIENSLISSKFIEQAVVIGDKRKFCSAVIVPAQEAVLRWAAEENVVFRDYQELLQHPRIYELIQSEIDRLMVDFAGYEQIKKFCLIKEPFSIEGGELTPTLKVKRKIVEEKYRDEIERMYVS